MYFGTSEYIYPMKQAFQLAMLSNPVLSKHAMQPKFRYYCGNEIHEQ